MDVLDFIHASGWIHNVDTEISNQFSTYIIIPYKLNCKDMKTMYNTSLSHLSLKHELTSQPLEQLLWQLWFGFLNCNVLSSKLE